MVGGIPSDDIFYFDGEQPRRYIGTYFPPERVTVSVTITADGSVESEIRGPYPPAETLEQWAMECLGWIDTTEGGDA